MALASSLIALSYLVLSIDHSQAAPSAPAELLGKWKQDQMGLVVTHERLFDFGADGSYEFLVTSRPTGSTERKPLAREVGKFAVQGDRLVLTRRSGGTKTVPFRIERDKYVGDVRLVFVLPDGTLDVYYRR